MSYIIHFTPSELATLDLIIDSLKEEDKGTLAEKITLAIGLNSELGVVIRLEDKELSRLSDIVMDAYLYRKAEDTGFSYMAILRNVVLEIGDNVWSDNDVEIG